MDRAHVAAPAQGRVARGARGRPGAAILAMLGKAGIEHLDEGNVEPVEPDHRLVGLIAMIVPQPRRGQDQVVLLHIGPLAVERGEGALARHDEP